MERAEALTLTICDAIGEQKIDILVAADLASPMARVAQASKNH
jgi:hypothetical protein